MSKITTTELVNKIFAFCEAYSGIGFFPYQAQFGKRIIRSTIENDGEEITALFSRQCLAKGSLVHMADGSLRPIEEVLIGEKVLAFDYDSIVPRKVVDSYCAGVREVYEIELRSGDSLISTLNHRFLDYGSKLFKPLYEFEAGDQIAYLDNKGKRKFSKIKKLRLMGDMETYDLEVEGAENFISQNILVHNSGKSETVATIAGGLAILLPILANMPMFVTDKRLSKYQSGLMIGIFAPTLNQAQISFNRMKKRMGSKHSEAIMSDPEINVTFDISNGQNFILSNGSLIRCQSASEGSNIEGESYMMIIVDEAQDVGNFKYSKSISPMGAFYNATKILIGTATTQKGFFYDSIERNTKTAEEGGKRNHFAYDYTTVVKYNPNYEKYIQGEKKRLGEDSDEFKMSYCLKWILERGMFIDSILLDSLADPDRDFCPMDTQAVHVAGIDLGKKSDSTVLAIGEVDFDNPVLVEQSKDLNVPDYIVYGVKLKFLLEIQGDNWEEQYYVIKEHLNNFNIVRLVVDATAVGSPIADRFQANLAYEVIPYVFSKQSKSDLFKHFSTELRAKRFSYPASPQAMETTEFKKFEQQFLDLEKSYSGQCMVVAHPNVNGAHDDYPDAVALMMWGAKGDTVSKPVTEKEQFYEKKSKGFENARNRITARRRG